MAKAGRDHASKHACLITSLLLSSTPPNDARGLPGASAWPGGMPVPPSDLGDEIIITAQHQQEVYPHASCWNNSYMSRFDSTAVFSSGTTLTRGLFCSLPRAADRDLRASTLFPSVCCLTHLPAVSPPKDGDGCCCDAAAENF